jgi:hypothetical protein
MAYYGSRIVSNMSPYHRTKVNFGAHSTAVLLAEFSKIVQASPQEDTTVLLYIGMIGLNCENKPFSFVR